MAPAMAALSAIGEAGLALSQWTGLLKQVAGLYEELHPKVAPMYCAKCETDIAFRKYADHTEMHKRIFEANEELQDMETTMECPFENCKGQIRVRKYVEHIKMHEVAIAAHLHALTLETKGVAEGTGDIKRGYVMVKRPRTTRNKE